MRHFTPVELAMAFALGGSTLAVAVPAFCRELHGSRLVEATEGLTRLNTAAVAYAAANARFPDSAPLTPATPPRGAKEVDPPGMWDGPTWKALGFRGSEEGVPHAFSFSFTSAPGGTSFVAQARGDLDGDGTFSTFETRGTKPPGDQAPELAPGIYVEAELE